MPELKDFSPKLNVTTIHPYFQVPSNMTQYYDHLIPAFQARLSKVADSVGPPDLKVWKWNEGKVLTYLAKKSRALAKKLAHTTIQTDGTSSEILIKVRYC